MVMGVVTVVVLVVVVRQHLTEIEQRDEPTRAPLYVCCFGNEGEYAMFRTILTKKLGLLFIVMLLTTLALNLGLPLIARATAITVNSTADAVANDSQCALREAIDSARPQLCFSRASCKSRQIIVC